MGIRTVKEQAGLSARGRGGFGSVETEVGGTARSGNPAEPNNIMLGQLYRSDMLSLIFETARKGCTGAASLDHPWKVSQIAIFARHG
ncbi:MAG TPA: hypothetical protein VGC82_04785, partial [Rhodopila sp.]